MLMDQQYGFSSDPIGLKELNFQDKDALSLIPGNRRNLQ